MLKIFISISVNIEMDKFESKNEMAQDYGV